jgi:hypothetical protein
MLKCSTFLFIALSVSVSSVTAQTIPGANDPDLKEILAYQLTMPKVLKMMQATRNFAEAVKNDPRFKRQQAIEAELEQLRDKEEMTDADVARVEKLEAELETLERATDLSGDNTSSLSQMAAAMKKEPLIANALSAAGVDAREYATFMLAYFQAGMVHGMTKSGLVKEIPKQLAATVNMDNVKFVAEHEKELEALTKEFESLNRRRQQ